ncbi:MAG: hypothetical protein COB46_02590 [Rhodospirillaceae bacterium]|nr:MAG: hypothetical protein COB46_02590 [Rhodospirillaceae bacterium]
MLAYCAQAEKLHNAAALLIQGSDSDFLRAYGSLHKSTPFKQQANAPLPMRSLWSSKTNDKTYADRFGPPRGNSGGATGWEST